jgi:galactose oxidase-like protein
VALGFEVRSDPAQGGLRIHTPRLPTQAVPGIYMLFVVDSQGVPSVGKRVLLVED